jgi:flagellar protein FlbD
MIKVTRLNNSPLILNSDLIEHVDVTPDTVITLVSGQKYMVQESADEVVERVVKFRQSLLGGQPHQPTLVSGARPFPVLSPREKSVNG